MNRRDLIRTAFMVMLAPVPLMLGNSGESLKELRARVISESLQTCEGREKLAHSMKDALRQALSRPRSGVRSSLEEARKDFEKYRTIMALKGGFGAQTC